MMADAKRKKFNAILIYSTSRFARNHEESIVYRNMLKREGVDVISITQPSVDYKTDILMNALYAVMDERYSIDLSENTKRGMKEKASRGIFVSNAPFGYRRAESNKPLVIHEGEGAIIRWIFESYIAGQPMFTMAKEINARGYKQKYGSHFDRRAIHRMLTNPTYKGYVKWTCDGETIYMPADHKGIVDEETFERVQALLKENIRKRAYKVRDSEVCAHWLAGLLRCTKCGTTFVHVKGYNGRSNRFRCGNYANAGCANNHSVSAAALESIVITYLKNINVEEITFVKDAKISAMIGNNVENAIKQLEKALDRAKQAYLQEIDTLEEYKANKESITREISSIKATMDKSEAPVNYQEVKTNINNLVELLLSDEPNKIKNQAAKNIISKIIVDEASGNYDFYFFS
jgi:DNA invertase Pin-like site-specific DNA recombinase